MTQIDAQLPVIRRGCVDLLQEAELVAKLREGRPLRVKFGADPSAPDLHLGHTVALTKLRQLQDLGHQVIFLIGDFTGMIGDPTGKSETRRPLSREEVRANAETYQQQVFKVLDATRTEVRFNSEWMDSMAATDVVRLSAQYTVARLLEREDFARRYAEQRPIGVHELLYPLVQGYDSVALAADIEVGGTDQRFNLLVGRELQRAYGQAAQVVLTMPLLEGTDGVQKMSKSLGNAIGIADPPSDMFGKLMSISDSLMLRYFQLLTNEDHAALSAEIAAGTRHPMQTKKELAALLVGRFHGAGAAAAALAGFEQQFQRGETPADAVRRGWEIDPAAGMALIDVLVDIGFAKSKTEARRLIAQGGVRLAGVRVEAVDHSIHEFGERELRVGSRRVAIVSFSPKKSTNQG